MAHAHFLQMGGFKLCTVDKGDDWWSKSYGYYCQSSTNGVRVWKEVMRYDHFKKLLDAGQINFPDLSEEEINDRSKADALSKGVALLQITWFIIQLVARARQHLTITEIELTTGALAGLNSIMYLFWWSKPLDVRCAIVIPTKEVEQLLATMGNGNQEQSTHSEKEKWTFDTRDFYLKDYFASMMRRLADQILSLMQRVILSLAISLHWRQLLNGICTIFISLRSMFNSVSVPTNTPSIDRVIAISQLFFLPFIYMFVSPMDNILHPYKYDFEPESNFQDAKDKLHSASAWEIFIFDWDMDWIMTMIFYSEEAGKRPLVCFSTLAGAIFGSIHSAAWHYHFPSRIEGVLWHVSSLTIVGVCLCITAGIPLYAFVDHKYQNTHYSEDLFWRICRAVLRSLPALVYTFSRVSLLTLALLSLRDLPESAFETVTWTNFIPHI